MNMPLNKLTSNSSFSKVQLGMNTDLSEAKKKTPQTKKANPSPPTKKKPRKILRESPLCADPGNSRVL